MEDLSKHTMQEGLHLQNTQQLPLQAVTLLHSSVWRLPAIMLQEEVRKSASKINDTPTKQTENVSEEREPAGDVWMW